MDVRPRLRWHPAQDGDGYSVEVMIHSPALAEVTLAGEHDFSRYGALKRALAPVVDCRDVVADISRCTFIDSTTVSVFLSLESRLRVKGGRLVLVVPAQQTAVSRLVEIMRLVDLVGVQTTRAAAFESLVADLVAVP